jgi:hypothetical protein
VSLFPFLDVLVCTMGSLILLLLVATNRIRAAAVERAKQAAIQERLKPDESSPPIPEPVALATEPEPEDDPTPEWQTRVEQLADERDALRNQLAQLKSRLATAQSAVMRTKVKAASTEDRLKDVRAQQEASAAERQRLQAEIDSLQSDLTDAQQRLTKAVERQQTAKSKFAFLPFDGRTGTTKRPILIECTQDHIRFLPEDIRLTPADLNGFTTGFNPLLVASRELIHYWKAYDRVHAADADPNQDADSFETDLAALHDKEREPYVLLLVRPNGAVAFHIAKNLLSQLKVPHGYELITDDMEIDASNPDPEAEQICQAAVTQVLGERDKMLQALARHREQQRDQLQLDPTAQTFVPKETEEPSAGFHRAKPSATGSGAAASATGAANSNSNRQGGSGGSSVRDGASIAGVSHGQKPSANQTSQQTAMARPGTRLSGANEPPEEFLPQSNSRRYENDGTKPFPFSGDRAKSASSRDSAAAASGSQPSNSRPGPRQANDPRAAGSPTNGATSGSNVARMKRRYLMPRSGIGLEKAITIRISSRRVLIGGEYEIPVEVGVKTESLIDRVLIAMDRVQTGWPSAGEGYHWVPTIKYEVIPGGEQVHQRLNSALFDLGLVSSVEYLESDPDAPKSSRETSRSRTASSAGGGAR